MAIRTHFLALLAFALSGCVSPKKIVFVDQAAHAAPPTIKAIRAEGEMLRISIAQDSAPAWVSGVQATVIDGGVYLRTNHISSRVSTTEFVVDMSDSKFPRDWRSKLYWIESDSISSPINPFIEHRREIGRSKVALKE